MDNNKVNHNQRITVFYDGACGLCAKEIQHYKNIAPCDLFEWVDITQDSEMFTSLGYTKQAGLRALHALDSSGEIHIGVDAFLLIWSQLKRWRFIGRMVSLPGIRHIANYAYKHFANWRFKKLGYGICQINKN